MTDHDTHVRNCPNQLINTNSVIQANSGHLKTTQVCRQCTLWETWILENVNVAFRIPHLFFGCLQSWISASSSGITSWRSVEKTFARSGQRVNILFNTAGTVDGAALDEQCSFLSKSTLCHLWLSLAKPFASNVLQKSKCRSASTKCITIHNLSNYKQMYDSLTPWATSVSVQHLAIMPGAVQTEGPKPLAKSSNPWGPNAPNRTQLVFKSICGQRKQKDANV